ncbi:MAG: hypothetical protein LUO95_00800 [Methylococcaceae bacterium]|nr:hypothetical protein [Methylococcaceae bacterium]
MKKGTILIPTGPVEHLHFICSDPVYHYPISDKKIVLLVNISSVKDGTDYDKTCILNLGDHPFIKHESYVYYKSAGGFSSDNISQRIAQGDYRIHDPCSDNTFNRILDGFGISEEVSGKIRKFYETHCK